MWLQRPLAVTRRTVRVCAIVIVVLLGSGRQCKAGLDDVADAVATTVLNISSDYLDNCLQPTTAASTQCTGTGMASRLHSNVSSAVHAALMKYSANLCGEDGDQTSLRVQLDSMAITGRITEALGVFNERQAAVRISLLPTPEPMDASDIAFGRPTLAADGRWQDFVGLNIEDMLGYLSPNNRRISHYLYYRRDLLQALGINPPQTWDTLVEAVAKLNSTDTNNDTLPEYGICFNSDAYCGAPYVLMQIYFSMFVYGQPAGQAWLLDPKTLEPLAHNAAMKRALELFAELSKYNHPLASVGCQAGSEMFCRRRCAITLNSDQFRLSNDPSCGVGGLLGTAPPPGSPYVLDYAADELVPCTEELCPYAVPFTEDNSVLVNHAPLYVPAITVYTPNPSLRADMSAPIAAFGSHLNHYYADYYAALDAATAASDNGTAVSTHAYSVMRVYLVETAAAAFHLEPLLQLGYNAVDAEEFLLVSAEIQEYGNNFKGIPVPGASVFRTLLGAAAINATHANASLPGIMDTLNAKFRMVPTAFNNTPLYLKLYHFGIGYNEDSAAAPLPGGGISWKHGYTAGIAAGTACFVLLVGGILLLVWHRNKQGRRSFFGKLLPPGVGPATTLLVTDIQGSTDLWEVVPEAVMEQALAIHHSTLEQLLDEHRGYESATEGDSFILAFHTPSDALQFAVAAQKALLSAPWPRELLKLHKSAATCMARTQAGNGDAMLSRVVQSLQSGSLESAGSLCHRPAVAGCISTVKHWFCWRRLEAHTSAPTQAADMQQAASGIFESEHRDAGSATNTSKEEVMTTGLHTRSCSFGWALSQAWVDDEQKDLVLDSINTISPSRTSFQLPAHPPARTQLIWQGLRIRMGLHAGLSDPRDLAVNATSRRTHYSGAFATLAKSVCDCGHGGQILLSSECFAQLDSTSQAGRLHVLHMGEHVLAAKQPPQVLYQVVVPGLEARLQSFPPLRSRQVVCEGVLAATVGTATVAFMGVGAVGLLMAWNAETTKQALQIYHDRARKVAARHAGYLPELVDGLALAVFPRPEDAVRWALSVQKGLLSAPWPPELLANELCEPVMTTSAIETEEGITIEHQVLALRGLRPKVGIATGEVLDYISPATGRIMYRGRVMNWAARIFGLATSGQVLCMEKTWQVITGGKSPPEGLAAVSAGLHMLKGVKGPVQLQSCTYTSTYVSESTMSRSGTRRTSAVSVAPDDSPIARTPWLRPAASPSVLDGCARLS